MDGTEITAVRTAAGSALSARLLAREDARVLTIVGTGVQAGTHARIVPLVRDIAEIRIAGRTPAKAEALAAELAAEGLPARAFASPREAIAGADVVCATTSAEEPALRREWLSPGAHVTSVGFSTEGRELDDATVADALVVVESRETALAPHPGRRQRPAGADPRPASSARPHPRRDRRAGRGHHAGAHLAASRSPSTSRWASPCRTPPPRRSSSRGRGTGDGAGRSRSLTRRLRRVRTQVGIVGAGPAGLALAQLLAREGSSR